MRGEFDNNLPINGLDINRNFLVPRFSNGLVSARVIYVNEVAEYFGNNPDKVESVYTSEELTYCQRFRARPFEHHAVRLAAKQIILEHLADEELGWQDISVRSNELYAPSLVFSDRVESILRQKGVEFSHVSLSHEGNIALAFCVMDKEGDILRIGADVCSDTPFSRKGIERPTTFSEAERAEARQQEFPAQRLAMIYAVKESVVKILETLSGWIWKEIEVSQEREGNFSVHLSDSAKERLEEIGAAQIITQPSFREGIGAMAFSAALIRPLDRRNG